MIQSKSFTHSPQPVLFFALLLIATFGAACSGANRNSASGGGVFEGEITSKTFVKDQTMETLYAIKGSRNRIETHFSQRAEQPGVMESSVTLMDLSSGTTTMLFPKTKTYMTMNWGEMAEEITEGAGKVSPIDFPKVTSTGKTETIAGITCEHWLFDDKTDICMAKGLGYFGGGGSGGILDKLKNFAVRDKFKAANPEFAKFVEGGAFPLKMTSVEFGQSKAVMEVTRVERKSLDDSLFTVPADYKKTEIPGMQEIPEAKR
jgi:uncharacterized protein DUF4412